MAAAAVAAAGCGIMFKRLKEAGGTPIRREARAAPVGQVKSVQSALAQGPTG